MSIPEWLALGAVLSALVLTMVISTHEGWKPIADEALMELRIRDIPSHLPLVGVYSRFGWSHPGPTAFYLLAPFYWLLGRSSSGLLVGAVALHSVFAVFAWWTARQIDRVAGLLVLLSIAAVLASTPAPLVRTPWNPYVVLVAGTALLVAGWSFSLRWTIGSVALFPIATLLIQSHVVNAPATGLVTVGAIALSVLLFRGSPRVVPRRAIGVGAVVSLMLWLPPIAQQLLGSEGNLTLIVREGGGSGVQTGVRNAVGVLSQAFALWPAGLRTSSVSEVLVNTSVTAPVWIIVPIIGLVTAIRRRDERFIAALVLCSCALVGLFISIALTTGGLFNYLIVMTRPVAAVSIAVGVAAILSGSRDRRSGRLIPSQPVLVAVSSAVVVMSLLFGIRQVLGDNPFADYAPTITSLTAAVESTVRPGTVSVRSVADFRAAEVAAAVMLQLERDGYRVWSPDMRPEGVGEHRSRPLGGYEVMIAPLSNEKSLSDEGWNILAAHRELTTAERRKIAELQDEITDLAEQSKRLESGAGTTPDKGVGDNERLRDRILESSEKIASIENGRIEMLIAGREPVTD